MAGTLFTVDAIKVFIAAEDHPPPHVHAVHPGQGWRARFRFSFLSDVAGLYRFRRGGHRPTETTLNAVLDAIMSDLPSCRAEWWATHGPRHGIGLVHRSIELRPAANTDAVLAKVSLAPGRNAVRIVAATYESEEQAIGITLGDGRRLRLTAGQHIEEAEEW